MRARIIIASAICLAVLIGGVAYAAIPHSTTGEISGCYKLNHPAKGALIVIDDEAGVNCPDGYAQLAWDESAPAGTLYDYSSHIKQEDVQVSPGRTGQIDGNCPVGTKVLGGGPELVGDVVPGSGVIGDPNAVYIRATHPYSDSTGWSVVIGDTRPSAEPTFYRVNLLWTCAREFQP